MVNTYLYIDDTELTVIEGISNGLKRSRVIDVIPENPKPWQDQVSSIVERIDKFDGILLDWRLTEELRRSDSNQEFSIKYSAEALAQEIRFLFSDKEKKILGKDIPIVLCSGNEGFLEYYLKDETGHDLFDEVYEKIGFTENHDCIVYQLNALADAYKILQTSETSCQGVLNTPVNIELDVRLTSEVDSLLEDKIPHGFVRFILNEVIKKPGVLIDEDTLAARLGVDRNESGEWERLLAERISPIFKYNGILSGGWNRWWSEGFLNWWSEEIDLTHPQLFHAQKRVDLIIAKTGLTNLSAAKKIKHCKSSEFWSVCEGTKQPIDPSEGLLVNSGNLYPWQEEKYVSLFALLDRRVEPSILNPLERTKFKYLKSTI